MAGVKKKTISMEETLYQRALERSAALGYESFSAYLQFLLEADTAKKPLHVRAESGAFVAPGAVGDAETKDED